MKNHDVEKADAEDRDATIRRRQFLCGVAAMMTATAVTTAAEISTWRRRTMADSVGRLPDSVSVFLPSGFLSVVGDGLASDPMQDEWLVTFPAYPDISPDAPVVVLRDGSRLAAPISFGADNTGANFPTDMDHVAVSDAAAGSRMLSLSGWSHRSWIPWDRVAAIIRTVPGDRDRRDRLWNAVLAESRNTATNTLFLIGGDRITGDSLTYDLGSVGDAAFSSGVYFPSSSDYSSEGTSETGDFFSIRVVEYDGAGFEYRGESRNSGANGGKSEATTTLRIPAGRVAVAVWGTLFTKTHATRPHGEFFEPPKPPPGWSGLRDGSFFSVNPWNIPADPIEIMTSLADGGFVHISADEISYCEPPATQRIWLSDQMPERYEENPFCGCRRGWGRDRTPEGAALRVPDSRRTVRHGFSQPVGSRLVFSIPAGFHGSFRAGFAAMTSVPEMSDSHSPSSPPVRTLFARSIRGRIRLDDRIIWEIPSHSPSDGMISIDFPIYLPSEATASLEFLVDPPIPGVPLADGSLCAVWSAASLWPAVASH